MSKNALGMIETYGTTAAVVALDAALKSANVYALPKVMIGGGLVAILFKGDVGSVSVAVKSGVAAASVVGEVVSSHVIPRPDNDTETILPNDISLDFKPLTSVEQFDNKSKTPKEKVAVAPPVIKEDKEVPIVEEVIPSTAKEDKEVPIVEEVIPKNIEKPVVAIPVIAMTLQDTKDKEVVEKVNSDYTEKSQSDDNIAKKHTAAKKSGSKKKKKKK